MRGRLARHALPVLHALCRPLYCRDSGTGHGIRHQSVIWSLVKARSLALPICRSFTTTPSTGPATRAPSGTPSRRATSDNGCTQAGGSDLHKPCQAAGSPLCASACQARQSHACAPPSVHRQPLFYICRCAKNMHYSSLLQDDLHFLMSAETLETFGVTADLVRGPDSWL